MGTDKALIPFQGRRLIERVIERVRPLADEMVVISNRPEDYRFLHLPLIVDAVPGRGALGGLYTALLASTAPLVAVIACDMPFVNAELLNSCREMLQIDDWDAVIPRTGNGFEPFHAVYRRNTCLPKVKAALDAGLWKVDSWFDQAKIRFLEPQETQHFDPHGIAFMNLNTPEDLQEAERLAQTKDGGE
jgi:molybdopterin-guanine dinucleotide biosynthesis protein A